MHEKDGSSDIVKVGAYSTTTEYASYLEQVVSYHEKEAPLNHIKKTDIIIGDASTTIHEYFEANPETVVALAYFDMDLYSPTRECLLAIKDRLVKGSIIGFDEFNVHDFCGETIAVKEVFGLDHKLARNRFSSAQAYLVIE